MTRRDPRRRWLADGAVGVASQEARATRSSGAADVVNDGVVAFDVCARRLRPAVVVRASVETSQRVVLAGEFTFDVAELHEAISFRLKTRMNDCLAVLSSQEGRTTRACGAAEITDARHHVVDQALDGNVICFIWINNWVHDRPKNVTCFWVNSDAAYCSVGGAWQYRIRKNIRISIDVASEVGVDVECHWLGSGGGLFPLDAHTISAITS